MQNNEIGLIVWGCKSGHRVFCSRVVDYNSKSISDTIMDYRSFLRYNLNNLTTYAIEFTDNYKVFTIYRSCNDNGTGGYVAITLYVPHHLRVKGLRPALDGVMDSYFKEFVHPVFGTYLDGKYDSIEQYSAFLDGLNVVPEVERFKYKESTKDSRPQLKLYSDISEVDSFFDTPYRNEFFSCQEVIFMSNDLYNQCPQTLTFNFPPTIITNVSEPEKLPQLYVGDNSEVVYLEINGRECTKSERYSVNVATDSVTVRLRRQYCEDLSISGNIHQLILQGKLVENNKVISIGTVNYNYKTYDVKITVNNQNVRQDGLIFVRDNNNRIDYPIKDSIIKIPGNMLGQTFDIRVKPCQYDDSKLLVDSFIPIEYVEKNIPKNVTLYKKSIKVVVASGVSDKNFYFDLKKGNATCIKVPITKVPEQTLELYFPEDCTLTSDNFDKESPETELSFKGGTLTITSKELNYDIVIPEDIKKLIKTWDFYISNGSRKNDRLFGGSEFKVKIRPEENITDGTLAINEVEYKYNFVEREGKIYPFVLYVKLDRGSSSDLYSYKLKGKDCTLIENAIYPYTEESVDIVVDGEKYNKKRTKKDGIITVSLSRKQGKGPARQGEGSPSDPSQPEKKIYIYLKNCDAFYINGNPIKLFNKSDKKQGYKYSLFKSQVQYIKKKNGEVVCRAEKNKLDYDNYLRGINERNGFEVRYDDEGHVYIEYKKLENPIFRFFKNKWSKIFLMSVLSLLVLAGGGYAAWYYLLRSEPSIPVMKIYVSVGGKSVSFGEKVDKIIIEGPGAKLLRSGNDNDGCFVEVLWNKDAVEEVAYDEYFNKEYIAKISGTDFDFKFDIKQYLDEFKKINSSNVTDKYNAQVYNKKISGYIQCIESKLSGKDGLNTFDEYAAICDDAPKTLKDTVVNYVLQQCSNMLSRVDVTDTLYNHFLTTFNKYKNNNIYKGRLEKKNKAVNYNNKIDTAKEAAKSYKTKLQDLSCNLELVVEVTNWYKELKEELGDDDVKKIIKSAIANEWFFDNAINGYSIFFNAKSVSDMDKIKLNTNYYKTFSKKQQEKVDQYIKAFDKLKNKFGITFRTKD